MSVSLLERIEEHEIEPELLESAPRRVRATYWSTLTFSVWLTAFFLIVVSVVYIAVQSWRINWLAENGRTTMATVTGCRFIDGSSGSCVLKPYEIENILFDFTAGGKLRHGSILYNAPRDNVTFTDHIKPKTNKQAV